MKRLAFACLALLCVITLVFYPGRAANGQTTGGDAQQEIPQNGQLNAYTLYIPFLTLANAQSTVRVTIGPDYQLPNDESSTPAMSQDGRYVAFVSDASNLIPGDTNRRSDVFVVDRALNTIARASVSSSGEQTSGICRTPSISNDGRYVVFISSATNLVSGDTNTKQDVFLHDMQTGQTLLVSAATNGTQATADSWNPKISADGRYVVYESSAPTLVPNDTNARLDVFLYDRQLVQTERVSVASNGAEGNDDSSRPTISGDGRYVAFQSSASNLVANDTNNWVDVFVRDRQTGETSLISISSGGVQGSGAGASITNDGRYVTFVASASNLVSGDTNGFEDVFVRDRQAGTTERVSVSSSGTQANEYSNSAQIAAGGRYVVFGSTANNLVAGDTNSVDDIFLRDLQTGTTTRLSLDSGGAQANDDSYYEAISADGTLVVFQSAATNLVTRDVNAAIDIFIHNRTTSQTSAISKLYAPLESNAGSMNATVSSDGRYVAFESRSTSLVAGDGAGSITKIFVRDLLTRQAVIASVSPSGAIGVGDSKNASISGDGQMLAFTSESSILVAADTNAVADIFVRNLTAGQTQRISVSSAGVQANDFSFSARISRDGHFVCFSSYATNLVSGDTNANSDVFVRNLLAGSTERVSLSSSASQANNGSYYCAISADGRFVAFQSSASNLTDGDTNGVADIFVRDRQTGQTTLVSPAAGGAQSNADSIAPSISDDGRYVAFDSAANNLVASDSNASRDVFVFDRSSNTMIRASLASDGAEGKDHSFGASLSADGRQIAFESIARNLVSGDTNNNNDVYTRNLVSGITLRASVSSSGGQGDNASTSPTLSASGKYVVFQSAASNLVSGDANALADIFLRDRGIIY